MFPNPNHGPAASAQLAVYAAIAGLVAGDLGQPECRAGLRPGGVFGAAMPEAVVHNHHGLALGLMVRQLSSSGESHPNSDRIEGLVRGVDR